MKSYLAMIVAAGALVFMAAPALADWNFTEPAKWVQPPDPNGWDVNVTWPRILADDFLCVRPGPITDFHFWLSAEDDAFTWAWSNVDGIHVSVHSDRPADPTGGYSRPRELLWSRMFSPADVTFRQWGHGEQGWYDPATGEWRRPDHNNIYQANIEGFREPFVQQGTPANPIVYWVDLSVKMRDGYEGPQLGWKTSIQHWNDDAVWGHWVPGGQPGWQEVLDPHTGRSLDLAFVITPEPSTLTLLAALGATGLLLCVRRRLAKP